MSRWWVEEQKRLKLMRSRAAFGQVAGRVHTRFSTDTPGDNMAFHERTRNRTFRHYSTHEILLMVRTAWAKGWRISRAAKEFKVPYNSMRSWMLYTRLPPTGRMTLPIMLKIVQQAKILYVRKFDHRPVRCFQEAVRRAGLKWKSVNVYLHFEAVPAVVGFPLYADPQVQLRCEACGRGERISGCPLYDPVPGVVIPGGPPPRPIAPAPTLDPRSPEAKTARFLAARAKAQLRPIPRVVVGVR